MGLAGMSRSFEYRMQADDRHLALTRLCAAMHKSGVLTKDERCDGFNTEMIEHEPNKLDDVTHLSLTVTQTVLTSENQQSLTPSREPATFL